MPSRVACALLWGSLPFFTASIASATTVSTLAGNGLSGFTDGGPATAEFMMPVGIAADAGGNVYVADAGAQRIRKVSSDGYVRTLAGSGASVSTGLWVPGGYQDGPAAQAKFNDPSAVAVDAHGAIYIADEANHCIRKLVGGVVTTFAGSPARNPTDGPIAAAGFGSPVGLAFDSDGNLYVADLYVGLRRISSDGNVTTIPLPSAQLPSSFGRPVITGVSVSGTGNSAVIFVAAPGVLFQLHPDGQPIDTNVAGLVENPKPLLWQPTMEGTRAPGYPFAVVALGPGKCLYADVESSTVRWKDGVVEKPLGATPGENAQSAATGFHDGDARDALYNEPLGLALLPNRSIAVADTGNRRIRLISGFDFRGLRSPAESLADLASSPGDYRIAYIGNSYSFSDTTWEDSIPGQLEARLNRDRVKLGINRHVRVVLGGFNASEGGIESYLNDILIPAGVNMVIWQFNSAFVNNEHKRPLFAPISAFPIQESDDLTAELKAANSALKSNHITFVVVLHPFPAEVSPLEDPYYRRAFEPLPYESYLDVGPRLHKAIADSGAELVDLFPLFLRTERSANHPALFGTRDFHFSDQGKELVANGVGDAIEQLDPWKPSK